MKKAVLYTVTFLLIQFVVSALIQGLYMLVTHKPISEMNAEQLIVSTSAASVAIIAVFIFLKWVYVSPIYLRSRPWGVLFWACVAALGVVLPSTAMQEQLPQLPNIVEEQLATLLANRWGYVAVGLLAPLAEELVFRGAVLRSLLQNSMSTPAAIALSALLFAFVHLNPAQMPHAFLVGLLLGWFYYRTRSILPGVAFHWVNNSVAYLLYNLYPDPDIQLVDIFGSTRNVAAAVAFSLLIFLPAIYQLYLRMRPASADITTERS